MRRHAYAVTPLIVLFALASLNCGESDANDLDANDSGIPRADAGRDARKPDSATSKPDGGIGPGNGDDDASSGDDDDAAPGDDDDDGPGSDSGSADAAVSPDAALSAEKIVAGYYTN